MAALVNPYVRISMIFNKRRKYFYWVSKFAAYINNCIILVTFVLAFFWIYKDKPDLEAWIALFGIVSIVLSKIPTIFKKLGYEEYPFGKGVISKGGCWIDEGQEEFRINLQFEFDRLKTKIDYIPTERVMAHFNDGHLVFKRREGLPKDRLRVDYELIKIE